MVKESTIKDECYTPLEWVTRCKSFAGLKPCERFAFDFSSTGEVNEYAGIAHGIFTKELSFLDLNVLKHLGVIQHQHCAKGVSFFYRPPYSLNNEFSLQLERLIQDDPTWYGVILVNNNSDTGWFKRLESLTDYLVLPKGRISFLDDNFQPRKRNRHWQAIMVRLSGKKETRDLQINAVKANTVWTSYGRMGTY